MIEIAGTRYGSIPVSDDPEDVSGVWTWSLDLRQETGGPGAVSLPDESCWAPPGTFTLPVFPTMPGHMPVGELRVILNGKDVRIVGARTERTGVVEVTASEVQAMIKNPGYAATMRAWLDN